MTRLTRAIATIVLACWAGSSWALHRETDGAVQITSGVSHEHPSGRAWGNELGFASSQDLAATGNTTRQIFVFNLAYYDCFSGTTKPTTVCANPLPPYLRQLTVGPGTPNNPTVSRVPQVAGQHQYMIFDAAGTFTGGGGLTPLTGAAATRRQIFKLDRDTNAFQRMTEAADGDSERPSVNGGGGIFVFESTARTIGDRPNAAGTRQVYLYDWNNGGGLKRVSFARSICGQSGSQPCPVLGRSISPSIDEAGKEVAFESTADLLGDGHDTGVPQIFYARYDKGHTQDVTLFQVTHGNGASRNPVIAEGGRLIVFETVATDLPGSPTAPAGSRIVIADMATPASPTFTHVTRPDLFGDCHWPTLNPKADDAPADSGTGLDVRIAMICTGDPLQNGTTGNRVFVWASRTTTLYQLTGSGDVRGPMAANLGRWFVTFASDGDLRRTGACGYQIYSLNYNTDVIGTVVPWQPASGPGEVPPDAVPTGGSTTIGQRSFEVVPGLSPGGSTVTVTTRDGTVTNPVVQAATIGLGFGAPSASGEVPITVDAARVRLPPVPIGGGFGLCFHATATGSGTLSCNGGGAGGDLTVTMDHVTDDADPNCLFGCRETDPVCQGLLGLGPHAIGGVGVCNDRQPRGQFDGPYLKGGARVSIPATFSLSIDPGIDGMLCTADDLYSAATDIPVPTLRLVTGGATGRVLDRDAETSQVLETSENGSPFSCNDLRLGNLGGARLVGSVPILDFPGLLLGLRDVLVGFDLVAARGAPNGCGASCNTSADCDDGNACNGAEFCGTNRLCVPGTPPACDDGDVCNGAESCDPALGCVAGVPCNDGDHCNGEEICDQQAGCRPGTPLPPCEDGDLCNGTERCDPQSGLCIGGTPLNCDDQNSCTADSCDAVSGCGHTNVPGGCDDGNGCTVDDACTNGACVGTPVVCVDPDGDVCTGAPACRSTGPGTHTCDAMPPPSCDDGNPCTDDACDAVAGCQHVNNTAPCSDGNRCTSGDVCTNGSCVGVPRSCPDNGNLCDGVPACDAASGLCVNGPPVSCNDGNPCTADACSPGTGTCTFTRLDDGMPCSDGNACTGIDALPDVCSGGFCIPGGLLQCDDGNRCLVHGTCDPDSGCPAATPRDCDDRNPCTVDSCDPTTGCVHTDTAATCDDHDACTGTVDAPDHCVAGGCEPGVPVLCNDGDFCNGLETCDPHLGCVAGEPPSCDDGNVCTSDGCHDGACVHAALDGVPCNDDDACTSDDVCSGGMCAGTPVSCVDDDVCDGAETCDSLTGACRAGTPLSCDDGDECTIDLPCDPAAGCRHTRKPNFVVCRLEALITLVRSYDPADLGGRHKQQVLLKRLAGARRRAEMGLVGSGARSVANLRRASKRVHAFVGLVQGGMFRGRIEAGRGQRLVALAADTQGEIGTLVRSRS